MTVDDNCPVDPAGQCELEIINAVTPSTIDGINDYFRIINLDDPQCFLSNTVEIYNRWGILVYSVDNYDNNVRAFRGVSEGRATVDKGAELPTGTYFYILRYTTAKGITGEKDGYLYLTR